jgi:hypothetical protein
MNHTLYHFSETEVVRYILQIRFDLQSDPRTHVGGRGGGGVWWKGDGGGCGGGGGGGYSQNSRGLGQ